MAESERPLTVVVAKGAADELDQIWQRNATQRGLRRADAYNEFLDEGIKRLATEHVNGRAVEEFDELRAITLKWNRGRCADGHILIYEIDPSHKTIVVLHVFRTKQDVSGRLRGERS